MSAGRFEIKAYQASYDADAVHPIRVQPETLTLSVGSDINGDAVGSINNPISAQISNSRRGGNLRPRTVTIRWDEGGAPAGYQDGGTIELPWLKRADFLGLQKGDPVTYLGGNATLVGKTPEYPIS